VPAVLSWKNSIECWGDSFIGGGPSPTHKSGCELIVERALFNYRRNEHRWAMKPIERCDMMIKCACGGKKELFAVSCGECGHVNEPQVVVIFLGFAILLSVLLLVPFQ